MYYDQKPNKQYVGIMVFSFNAPPAENDAQMQQFRKKVEVQFQKIFVDMNPGISPDDEITVDIYKGSWQVVVTILGLAFVCAYAYCHHGEPPPDLHFHCSGCALL